ncbi:MAG: helix-turn-helix domain-containing protein [Planctomycetota bacterium]|nr:helix-turn-helix domain-containing protein [Planctomycetota bacterium]
MASPFTPTATPTAGAASVPRIGLTREETADAIGVSARTIDTLIADRTSGFPVVRIGARVIIPIRELADWLALRTKGGTP